MIRPLRKTRRQPRPRGLGQHAAAPVLQDKLRRLAFFRSEEDARPARREHSINFARHDQAAQFGAHRSQMQVGGGKALPELFRGLKRQEAHIAQLPPLRLLPHPTKTRPISDE